MNAIRKDKGPAVDSVTCVIMSSRHVTKAARDWFYGSQMSSSIGIRDVHHLAIGANVNSRIE